MDMDSNVDASREYLVRSIYFDDYENSCYYENEYGLVPRAKFRVRSYNNSREYLVLEKKEKVGQMTRKTQQEINIRILEQMKKGKVSSAEKTGTLIEEWNRLAWERILKPVEIVEYSRTPFIYRPGNVRITIDKDISASHRIDSFFDRTTSGIPIMQTGYSIIEVKYDSFLPGVIYSQLRGVCEEQITFSKYYLGRKALYGRLVKIC